MDNNIEGEGNLTGACSGLDAATAHHLSAIKEIEYRRAVEGFDRLWETGGKQERMTELLQTIEAHERMQRMRAK